MDSKILVVDDVTSNLTLVLRVLQKAGYEAEGVTTGKAAIDFLTANKNVRLILLDLGLPDMTGFEVMKATASLKKARGYKICILSAKGKREDVAEAVALGADDYLLKPINGESLLRKLKELCPNEEIGAKRTENEKHTVIVILQDVDFLPDIAVEGISSEGLHIVSSAAIKPNKILKFSIHNWDEKSPPVNTDPLLGQVVRCKRIGRGDYRLLLKWLNVTEPMIKKIQALIAYAEYLRKQAQAAAKAGALGSNAAPGSAPATPATPTTPATPATPGTTPKT